MADKKYFDSANLTSISTGGSTNKLLNIKVEYDNSPKPAKIEPEWKIKRKQESAKRADEALRSNPFFNSMMEMKDSYSPGDTQQEYAMERSQFLDVFPFKGSENSHNDECSEKMKEFSTNVHEIIDDKQECETIRIVDRHQSSNRIKIIQDITETSIEMKSHEYFENMLGKKFDKDVKDMSYYGDDLIYETGFSMEKVEIEVTRKWKYLSELGSEDIIEITDKIRKTSVGKIPSIYHLVWYGCERKFELHHFIALISLVKNTPDMKLLIFHTDCQPNSNLWSTALCYIESKYPGVFKVVKTHQITHIWNNEILKIEHRVDVYKLMLMMSVGGVYLDDDLVTITPATELLDVSNKPDVPILSEESEYSVSNAWIASNTKQKFIARWIYAYKTYSHGQKFGRYSVVTAWTLWRKYPREVNIVKNKMIRPNWQRGMMLTTNYTLFNWMKMYNVHFQPRFFGEMGLPRGELNLEYVVKADNVIGELCRYVLFNRWRPRRESCAEVSSETEYPKNSRWYVNNDEAN